MKSPITKTIIYAIILIGVAVMIMPFAWMILTSFKLNGEVESWPPKWVSSSFNNERDINIDLVRAGGVTIDFSAMTIEEFFNLNKIIRAQTNTQSPLVFTINDDPPYRGEMTIALNPSKGYVEYAENLSVEELKELSDLFTTEAPLPDEIIETYSNMAMIEDPMAMINSLLSYLYFDKESPLTRKELVKSFRTTGEQLAAYITKNGEKLINHNTLTVNDDDSDVIRKEKTAVKEYVTELIGSMETRLGKFNLYLDDFSKGMSTLQYEEINSLKTMAAEIFINLEAPGDKANWAVLRLTDKYITTPLSKNLNLLDLGLKVYDFYNNAQNKKVTSPIIKVRFREKEQIITDLKAELEKSPFSEQILNSAESIIDSDYVNSTNKIYTELDHQFNKNLLAYNLTKEENNIIKAGLTTFAELIASKTADNEKLKESINAALNNGSEIEPLIASSALEQSDKDKIILEYGKIMDILSEQTNDIRQSKILIGQKLEADEFAQYYTKLFSDIYNKMEIIEAPEFVKTVNYKNLRSIEIYLDGVHPVWLWDEAPEMKVNFTFGETFLNVFQNYVNAWNLGKYFGYYYFNTVFVALATTILDILFASMAAFAFAKLKFFGKNFIFMLFLSTMMVPGEVLLVPNYITLSAFGWIDTYYALIVPWTVSVFVIFLLRQHFMSIPDELYDAGRIDGISKWGFLWKVMVPLSKPVIITGSLLKFIGSWNSFLWVLIVTKSPEVRTLPVGLANFSSEVGTLYNQLMAASTFSMLPVVILFLFVQKYFIQGIARTGLK